MQPDESDSNPSVQLPLWAENPPEEAGPLLDVIDRLRARAWAHVDSTLRHMVAASTISAILQRQASAMESMIASFQLSLLPEFTGDDYAALETAVLALIPTKPEEIAAVEEAIRAASADPENRSLVARITERMPNRAQAAKLAPWAAFVMVSLAMLDVAPEVNPNDLSVLAMILMVVLYLLPPRSGS